MSSIQCRDQGYSCPTTFLFPSRHYGGWCQRESKRPGVLPGLRCHSSFFWPFSALILARLSAGFGQVGLRKSEVISGTPFQVALHEGLPSFSPSRCNAHAEGTCGRLAHCGVCFGKSQPQPLLKAGANVRYPGQLSVHSVLSYRVTCLVTGAFGRIGGVYPLALWAVPYKSGSWPAFLAASGEVCLALLDEGFDACGFRRAVPLPEALLRCVLLLWWGGSANSSSKILPIG